jgi:bifunctional non-homologous end joining protein LigD
MAVTITNAGRVVYPATGHTKGDVVEYYRRAAPRLLPHLARRPLTLRRFPRGVGQPGFFQKNVPKSYPASMQRVEMPKHGGVTVFPCVSEEEHLVFLANQGVIELHVPSVRAPDLVHPDRFIIDLDPPENSVALARKAARILRQELASFGLESVPVATGSKGYHVVVAITPSLASGQLSRAAEELAALVVQRHPTELTTAFRIARREGKVFVDWMRNRVPGTVVAPFSLRARAKPSIALPFEWDELDEIRPDSFDLTTVDVRLEREDSLVRAARTPSDPAPFVAKVSEAFQASGLELGHFDRFRS